MILTAVVFILLLSVLVLIHEAGHYFVAKKFGIKVEEFGFGLPPRIWGKKIGETIYSINWLPIGGFVKLYGEDDAGGGHIGSPGATLASFEHDKRTKDHKDLHRAFFSRSAGQRTAVIVAGVIMNALLAIGIYYIFMFVSNFQTELPLLSKHHFFGVNQREISDIIISEVSKNSPAAASKITPESKIISVNGQKITDSKTFTHIISQNKGKQITLEWQDVQTSKKSVAQLTPRVNPPKGEGSLGIAFFPVSTVVLSYDTPVQKLFSGIVHPTNLMIYNFVVLKYLIGVSVQEKNVGPISQGVSGPVGIYNYVGTIVQIPDIRERVLQILNLASLLSISLAFFNVLPIPGLDGGRLFFIIIEVVTGRKVNEKFEGYAHAVGMALLIGLIILITFKDITQQFFK